jgi:EthD domain
MYPVWKLAADGPEPFRQRLLGPVASGLRDAGARHVRISVVDADVAPAAALRIQNTCPGFDALISLWVDTAVWRERYEAVFREQVARYHGYLVCESAPIPHDGCMRGDGSRVEGMCQVVFLQKPPRLSYEEWIGLWQGSHTQVAIDTQSTFGYRQNVIVRALSYAAPAYSAIVEENFPAAAMSSQHAFYDAVGDDARYKANMQAMMQSCARFIDMDRIDVVPTSEYNWAGK